METIKVNNGQSVIDMAIQLYGNYEGVFTILSNNPTIDNIQSDITGMYISYNPVKSQIPIYFDVNKIKITTK